MEQLLQRFTDRSKEILRDNLVGVYLHGSAVMGCFNPEKSDIDLIIVVKDSMSNADKRAYMDMVVDLNADAPAKGIEMSIVKKDVCSPFVYPTPFELHFSVAHLNWYLTDPDNYILKMNGADKDLAAHFTIILNRGKCLYGAPIKDVFAPVPKADYLDSIYEDIADAAEDISGNTMYITLNLARVLVYKKEGLILSKKEGGEWALGHLPAEYHALIKDALKEYEEAASISYDLELATRYAEYMLTEISRKDQTHA
jgi:streptomycin 3"-adenylyltransferase